MNVAAKNSSDPNYCDKDPDDYTKFEAKDLQVQLSLSLALGISAFVAFCILRPRWKSLYAARRRHLDPAIGLPALPDSLFGWMPALYRITEEQVLACGGLDAYVFLSFFKMSMRLFLVLLFFAGVVLAPIHSKFEPHKLISNSVRTQYAAAYGYDGYGSRSDPALIFSGKDGNKDPPGDMNYLWAYLVFTYFFTFLVIWFLNSETFKIIRVRQEYLGTQSTITDRTFRLTGIPKGFQDEAMIKDLVEKLEIGKVESVMLCRNWGELDGLIQERAAVLHKLEVAWAKSMERSSRDDRATHPNGQGDVGSGADPMGHDEESGLTGGENGGGASLLDGETRAHQYVERERPVTRIWYGFLGLQSRKTDAIDYYEEKLRQLDSKIQACRKKEYEPADIAFVTMDSIAACQMAIQALLDPKPGQLLTKLAPAPSDVVWRNTYTARSSRRLRSWTVTFFITTLSIFWLLPVGSIASLLSLCTISKWWPELSEWLTGHETVRALVQAGLTTGTVSALNLSVPYLYEWLSHKQGFLSRGEVELSIISKNFFFNFFNIFLVFTLFGTATRFWPKLQEDMHDITNVTRYLATQIELMNKVYINFIMLQGIGLTPFRLLEFGSVFLYPWYKILAKTPRERSQVDQPPIFSYGFYLPTALLMFILCLVYSVLPNGYLVLILGLIYFFLSYYTYKYQLLYAMEAPTHATGGAWRIIAYRIVLGLLIFQLTMTGILALKTAFVAAVLVLPLMIITCWYSYYFRRRFEPLTKYISLRSIRREEHAGESGYADEAAMREEEEEEAAAAAQSGPRHDVVVEAGRSRGLLRRRLSTVDEDRERGLRFINPSLVVRLEQPWIYQDPPPITPYSNQSDSESEERYTDRPSRQRTAEHSEQRPTLDTVGGQMGDGSTSSSLSLGDTHIWRDG